MNKNGVTYLFQIPGEVRFFDQPGAKLWPLPQKQWEELQRYRPEVVFWCLGGNSIDKDISPAVIYHEIIELVDTLKQAGVKKVYVSEISERGNFRKSPGLTKEAFEEKRKIVNRRLRRKLQGEFVIFPKIKFPEDYDGDLVHFGNTGDEKGLKKYFLAVRVVLLSYRRLSWLHEQFMLI